MPCHARAHRFSCTPVRSSGCWLPALAGMAGLGTRAAEHPRICRRPEAPGRPASKSRRTGVRHKVQCARSLHAGSGERSLSLPHLALASSGLGSAWARVGERASVAPTLGRRAQLGTQLLHSSQAHCISKGPGARNGFDGACHFTAWHRAGTWLWSWSWAWLCALAGTLCARCAMLRLSKSDARGAHRLNSKQPPAQQTQQANRPTGRAVT